MGTLANSDAPDEMPHICKDKNDLQRKEFNFSWKL